MEEPIRTSGIVGSLLTVDTSTALVIKMMNDMDEEPFILREIDDTHLLVDPNKVDWIKESVAAFFEENVWTREKGS